LQRPKKELEEEQRKIEEVAKLLSWEKRHEIGEIAIWHKRINNDFFREQDPKPTMCKYLYSKQFARKKLIFARKIQNIFFFMFWNFCPLFPVRTTLI